MEQRLMEASEQIRPGEGDALLVIDVQNDRMRGGALAVEGAEMILPAVNACLKRFADGALPIFASRDWHPPDHCSFQATGGAYPAHCVGGTPGADFATAMELPRSARILSKARSAQQDAESAFQESELEDLLRAADVTRIFVAGLTTEEAVLETVRDALARGFAVRVAEDAIAGRVRESAEQALTEMLAHGARPVRILASVISS